MGVINQISFHCCFLFVSGAIKNLQLALLINIIFHCRRNRKKICCLCVKALQRNATMLTVHACNMNVLASSV